MTSLGWDVGRAVTTVVGLAVLGRPVLAVLRRAATKASFAPAVSPQQRLPEQVAPLGRRPDTPDARHAAG
jgi:hypothetical protein